MDQPIMIHSTFPIEFNYQQVCNQIIKKKLAACVQVAPVLISYFEWDEKLQQEKEVLLTIKTIKKNYPDIAELILSHHPYEVPEIISINIDNMNDSYQKWFYNQINLV